MQNTQDDEDHGEEINGYVEWMARGDVLAFGSVPLLLLPCILWDSAALLQHWAHMG